MPHNGSFPSKEAELNTYLGTAVGYLTGTNNSVRFGLTPERITRLHNGLTAWNAAYPLSTNPNTSTKTIIDNKNDAKSELITVIREVFDDIPASVLTNEDRNTLNIHERSAPSASPVPDTRPVGKVDTSKRLQHTVSFSDEATPTSRAKPHGVRGCQIWCYIGTEPPTGPKQFQYLATDTASPYVAHFEDGDANKNACYILRWENTRGECGPWSETVMATITA